MKDLLLRLSSGLNSIDIKKDEQNIVDDFLQKTYITKKNDLYKLNSLYRFGSITLMQSGSAYLRIIGEESKDLFIEDTMGAKEGDIVVAMRLLAKRGTPAASIVEIVGKLKSYSVGYIDIKDGKKQLLNLKTSHPFGVDELSKYAQDDVFMVDYDNNITFLGNLADPKVDEKIVLAQFNKHDEFSKEVLDSAKSFKDVDASHYIKRVDLRELNFCTIDPTTAKDFDDAIYFDEPNFKLYVAIADVSEYVKPFGEIDNEAIYRSFSIYLPHRSIPMLPRELSETLCSLQSGVDRLAYVFEIDLDKTTLEVANSKVYEAIINSKRRFNYDEVDAIFEGELKAKDELEERLFENLKKLKVLTDRLKKQRLTHGYDFSSAEIEMSLDSDTNIISTSFSKETPSHALIEDCMLLANKEAAKRFSRGIFRIHEAPSQAKLQKLYLELAEIGIFANIKDSTKETIDDLQAQAQDMGLSEEVDTLIIRSQMQARYTPFNVGHFGLGFDAYTHFTSPIRRYSDLLVHRLLKAIEAKDKLENSYVLRNIESLTVAISEKEREASEVEREYMQRKFARWAEQNIGKTYKAKVTSLDTEATAMLYDEISGATLHLNNVANLTLFEEIEVSIDKVDKYRAKIFANVQK